MALPASAAPLVHLVARSRRRALLCGVLALLPAALALLWLVRAYGDRGAVLGTLGLIGLAAWVIPRLWRLRLIDATHAAHRVDGLFAQLEDSADLLLLPAEKQTGLTRLQRDIAARAITPLADAGELRAALFELPVPTIATAWAGALAVGLTSAWLLAPRVDSGKPPALTPIAIQSGAVDITPPDYLNLASRRSDALNLTVADSARLVWSVQLSAKADDVSIVFHDGDTIALTARGARTWQSPSWPARSTVYSITANGQTPPDAVFRIDALPDKPPQLSVASPQKSLRLLNDAQSAPQLTLAFEATDDHRVVSATARVTLASGSGEQVRFREQAIELPAAISEDGKSLGVGYDIDLLELGMKRGDELYLFAEVTDNRPETPNVGTSGTYIVRWPDDEAAPTDPVVTMAMDVLPEYFRSQRQIIIDTEKLIGERADIDKASFAQRAQTLAIDQKLLRLRYGQYLGEETDSGIGAAAQYSNDQLAEEDAEHDTDHDSHDHAAHNDSPGAVESMTFGDAQAAMDLYTHFHDSEEQATLFEPKTRGLLQQALAQMWDAELHLRLAHPTEALPFEYAALDFIKRVQQSSRIYLRRTGFRPTPIDEARRLTGELDDILATAPNRVTANDGDLNQLRRLFEALASDQTPADSIGAMIDGVMPSVRLRTQDDPAWLTLLGALQRARNDAACTACLSALPAAIWRHLEPARAAPTTTTTMQHPLERAYARRLQLSIAP